jgi:hypothetical protein
MRRGLWICGLVAGAMSLAASDLTAYSVRPSDIDHGVAAFDEPNYILFDRATTRTAPLVVFLTGTGGQPSWSKDFLSVVAGQGYRVIGLEYDDTPAVSQVCPRDPDPACSADFRRMRIYGGGPSSKVHNPAAETIVVRLVQLLRALDKGKPDEGWGQYLNGDQPSWDRLVLSGMSQGAGMAAYMAKAHAVRRVVLFSSPWDVAGPDHAPAPWLSEPSQTPLDRWYAEYHEQERTAALIVRAYAALRIPPDHIRVFKLGAPALAGRSDNPYHVSTIRNPGYEADWRAMFGSISEAPPK